MRVVEARVDVADEHGGLPPVIACACGRMDLPHVPLERRQRIRVGGRRVRQVARLRRRRAARRDVGSWTAKPAVAAAFSTFESLSRLSRNDESDELAMTTPISG